MEMYFFSRFPVVLMRYEGGFTRLYIFLIGTIVGKREYEGKGYRLWNVFAYAALFVLIRAALIVYVDPQGDLYTILHHVSYVPGALFIAGTFPPLRSMIPGNPVRRALEVLGDVSLEVYLVHGIYAGIYRTFPIYQRYDSPGAYLLFVALPSVFVVLLVKYGCIYLRKRKKIRSA